MLRQIGLIANNLKNIFGVIEAKQTKQTINDLIIELKQTILTYASTPTIVIGHSWGAWLTGLFAEYCPALVNKIILISTPPFENKYIDEIKIERNKRLNIKERKLIEEFINVLNSTKCKNKNKYFAKIGKLYSKIEHFKPILKNIKIKDINFENFFKIEKEANELRSTGLLLKKIQNVKCPAIFIHGDYDTHSFRAIKTEMKNMPDNYKFVLLKNCGHYPWNEQYAKSNFFQILKNEIRFIYD